MHVFLIAITIGLVIRLVSKLAIWLYLRTEKTEEEIRSSKLFHAVVLIYGLNDAALIANTTVMSALAVKTYILS